ALVTWNIRSSGQQIGDCCNEPVAVAARYEPFQTTFSPFTFDELISFNCENNVLDVSPPGNDQLLVSGASPFGRYAFALSPVATTFRGVDRDAEANATVVAATSPVATTKYTRFRI